MVEERITDGRRIAQLLASELEGRAGDLDPLSVVDADPDVEPTTDGALAYRVVRAPTAGDGAPPAVAGPDGEGRSGDGEDGAAGDGGDGAGGDSGAGEEVATVHVHPHRVRLVVSARPAAVADRAADLGLRVRRVPAPARTLVFVESGAATKRAADALGVTAGGD